MRRNLTLLCFKIIHNLFDKGRSTAGGVRADSVQASLIVPRLSPAEHISQGEKLHGLFGQVNEYITLERGGLVSGDPDAYFLPADSHLIFNRIS